MLEAPLLLFGSPHPAGATAALLRAYCHKEDIPFHGSILFDAYKERPLPCIDCGYCKKNAGCSLADLGTLYKALERAAWVIFAAPVYNAGLPAPLKAVVDRMQVYYNARFSRGIRPPIAVPKKAVLLLTAGSERDYTSAVLEQLAPMFTVTNCKLHGAVCMSGLDRQPYTEETIMHTLNRIPPPL